jgi:hypothetical protein
VKLRVVILSAACTLGLHGQYPKKGFDFTEACFKNPRLPYCPGRDFAPAPAGKNGAPGATAAGAMPLSTIDAAGIDWRFADPAADAIAVLNGKRLSSAPFAHGLIGQLASPGEAENAFGALSGVNQVALSVAGDKIVIWVTGRPADSILPAPKAGWKSVPLAGNAVLMGTAEAVDQAAQRMSMDIALGDIALGELARLAQLRPADCEFWEAGSAKLAGKEAVSAGVQRFELTASMQDRLSSETAFEFDAAPDPGAIRPWLSTLGDAKIEGNAVHLTTSLDADATRRNLSQIAVSPLGQRLATILAAARYLPVRDSGTTVHTHPVIYGLDGGPREVK